MTFGQLTQPLSLRPVAPGVPLSVDAAIKSSVQMPVQRRALAGGLVGEAAAPGWRWAVRPLRRPRKPTGLPRFPDRHYRDVGVEELPIDVDRVKQQLTAQEATERSDQSHSIRQLLTFMGPALSTVLADPVMGLIDVLCLGQAASTLDLAALGPNLTIFNFIAYAFCFLASATTMKTSEYLSKDDNAKAAEFVSGALFVALIGGAICAAGLVVAPEAILGATGALPMLIGPAAEYARVRAVSIPAALATVVLQSGLLAQKDVTTPLWAIGASVLFNVVGDWLLVKVFGMGLLGSAYATTSAVFAGVALLYKLGYGKGRTLSIQWSMPSRKFWGGFAKLSVPLAMMSMCANLCFFFISSFSTQLDLLSCAAHQAVFAVWMVCAMAAIPLQQAIQVFLTEVISKNIGGKDGPRKLVSMVAKVAVCQGVLLGAACGGVAAYAPFLLARDARLWPIMLSLAPAAFLSLFAAPLVYTLDGVLMTTNDAGFLARTQVFNCIAMYIALAAGISLGGGVAWIWATLGLLHFGRIAQASGRVWLRNRPAKAKATRASSRRVVAIC